MAPPRTGTSMKIPKPAPSFIANFDSSSAMLRSTANYLKAKSFPGLGILPPSALPAMKGVGRGVNKLPMRMRQKLYVWSGWGEAASPTRLSRVKVEQVAEWAASKYPEGKFPGVMIGASNGALTHLCAALGIPWLPQTFLLPVKRSWIHPDEPLEDVQWSIKPARKMLDANPDIVLHHMHDPNQDRLMIQRMAYFRVKKLALGPAYTRFLKQQLEPGAPIYIVDCGLRWPTRQIQDRHIFQFGALGGADIREFMEGSPRVRSYLNRYKSHRDHWEPPEPDAVRPEAEWGFEPAMAAEIEAFAEEHGHPVHYLRYELPHDVSPMVADLYRWWNERRGVVGNRMLVESFIVHEPFWTIRTGSVPFWMVFNKEPSAAMLEQYLDARPPFDEIYMMLFSQGVKSVGLVPIEEWRRILGKARKRGKFIGVDEEEYPHDFAILPRYHDAIQQAIPARYAIPRSLTFPELKEFLDTHKGYYKVRWEPSGARQEDRHWRRSSRGKPRALASESLTARRGVWGGR